MRLQKRDAKSIKCVVTISDSDEQAEEKTHELLINSTAKEKRNLNNQQEEWNVACAELSLLSG